MTRTTEDRPTIMVGGPDPWGRTFEDTRPPPDPSLPVYRVREVPAVVPCVRCCAPGCGDKIKPDDTMLELTAPDGSVRGYLEHSCVDWFVLGHPDHGPAGGKGRLVLDTTGEEVDR